MSSVRLFTGLSLPPDIIANLENLLEEMRPLARIRWVLPANLHITTKFIGAWPFERLPELSRALEGMAAGAGFTAEVSGLRFLPSALVAGVSASDELNSLALRTDAVLRILGVPGEKRDYHPHITVARIPGRGPLDQLRERVASESAAISMPFRVTEFHLYQSEMSMYRKLATFALK